MPGTVASDRPSVAMSFANNFWGMDDAGFHPLLERMHYSKLTSDELKIFYNTRAAIEEDYARKMLALCRKPLGSLEAGTLRASLDTTRGEVEAMAKSHQSIAAQMKSELEEPLAAFAGGLKERRKIVQGGIEKLFKIKCQQTHTVNKARDRYEQDCLRIKGYLAQGHMVMGQEERKNKAKLEKTQIQLASSNTEYEAAVKILEETTGRWNREWKAACDKFQDLEEERLDFTKSSLWTFANVSSTVCVTDDASCEKIRLSLENCEVEKDIASFIKERGTGPEIPDAPKYINFRRGDISDSQSEASEYDYSSANFQRTINPAYRTSSPQPSTYESHHAPREGLAPHLLAMDPSAPPSQEATMIPHRGPLPSTNEPPLQYHQGATSVVPHNAYPQDGMTMYCRTDGNGASDRSSANSPGRPPSRESHSEYSNPTSFASQDQAGGKQSPTKQPVVPPVVQEERQVQKKKSGFFQAHSPFRRKSKHEKDNSRPVINPPQPNNNRNTWSPGSSKGANSRTQDSFRGPMVEDARQSGSPEPADPRAKFQLNVGSNVFDVASPDKRANPPVQSDTSFNDGDPIAAALAELKSVTKQSSVRVSADRYHGISTPAPGAQSQSAVQAAKRGTPPPSYDAPMKRLDAPQPAFTSSQMQQTRQKYVDQTANMFGGRNEGGSGTPTSHTGTPFSGNSRPSTRGSDNMRATSPAPQHHRATSPRPGYGSIRAHSSSPAKQNPQSHHSRSQTHDGQQFYQRAVSPQPQYATRHGNHSDMALQLAPGPGADDPYSSPGGSFGRQTRGRAGAQGRPQSYYGGDGSPGQGAGGRQRSKSAAPPPGSMASGTGGGGQVTRDRRPILNFARALYPYFAAIPEELSFGKGDILAVLRLQDDGWWEAEVARPAVEGARKGARGLVPSNYLVNC
ncbi:MAG: hypothetical protein M1814_006776 [Vezdaea aestivalis]|nr:MAG: hypothetical protein M1814_006776 [Vezdaea aestivalis]